MADTKKKRVRKPKKSEDSTPEEKPVVKKAEAPKEKPVVKKTVAKKTAAKKTVVKDKEIALPKPPKRADVTLTECELLIKYGRKFVKGQTFTAIGDEQVAFFKADKRFNVVEK